MVGAQPVLLPGKRFEYVSACPLPTPDGTMEGSFAMVVLRDGDGEIVDTFDAAVAKFGLSTKGKTSM